MRKMLTLLSFMAATTVWAGGGDDYAVANIPLALLKNANVVKRMETTRYEITEKNRAHIYYKVVYTILNEKGDPWSGYAEGYDKLRSVESFNGTLYDAMGKKIKSVKKADISDESGNDDASLIDDNRIKRYNFYYKVYPYTVEFESEVKYKGTMFLPNWMPQERLYMSVQESDLTVVCPANNPLHYKMFNYTGEPVIVDDKANKVYTWQAKNMPTVKDEYASPSWREITTAVYMATEKFMLEDYEGSNASWKDFGRFVYDLKKDRDELPADTKKKVHELIDGLPTASEKIKALYEYMQQNTRYVSIQLGIGGWQPFDASYVATKRYGDCKALTNFMYSLLKEAGIRSVYTVIKAGENNRFLLTDLPSSQFNHVILFVPNGKDTTWLECTSQTEAAGYLGEFTDNRYGIAVDENGGTLVRTPKYGVQENLQIRTTKATIDEEGNLDAIIKTNYRAEEQDRLHYYTNSLSKDKLMEFLKRNIELATYDVKSFSYKEEKGTLPLMSETLDLVADNYATVSGKRLFIMPNIISRGGSKLKEDTARKYDVVLNYEFTNVDSVELTIPAGYTAESLPQDVKLESKFGKYIDSAKL
jgi:hypothetical protein